MTTWVVLLRGINLASHKNVPMGELRELAEGLGLSHPETYVRSGNLVVDTDLSEGELVADLEAALEDRFGFDVPVICRSGPSFLDVARNHPFADQGLEDRMLHVAFLDRVPDRPPQDAIDADQYAPDRFVAVDRHVYLAYPNGSGRSKLNHALLEKKLQVSVTARNWRTVSKLAEMVVDRSRDAT